MASAGSLIDLSQTDQSIPSTSRELPHLNLIEALKVARLTVNV
jgi:hypothetical protein